MYSFTEKELIDLGFKANFETKESSGHHCDYTYYTLDFVEGGCGCLISDCFDEDNTTSTIEIFEELNCKPLSKEFVLACVKEFKS